MAAFLRRKNEDSLGVVELARDRLHLCIGQPARVRNYGERIATVQMIGEYVSGVEDVRHAPKKLRRAGLHGYQ